MGFPVVPIVVVLLVGGALVVTLLCGRGGYTNQGGQRDTCYENPLHLELSWLPQTSTAASRLQESVELLLKASFIRGFLFGMRTRSLGIMRRWCAREEQ